MKIKLTKLLVPIYFLSAVIAPFGSNCMPALADTLKGGVQEQDVLKNNGPSLNRSDMGSTSDPFAGTETKSQDNGGGLLQAPPGAFDNVNTFSGAPKPLSGQAQDEGNGNFNGQNMNPLMEGGGPPSGGGGNPPPMQGNTVTPNNVNQDPEQTAQMKLLWDAWHKRVAETIYIRFNTSAQMLFKHSQPLACQVSYMVARDGRIGNVRILQPSANAIFNTMLVGVIKSIQGNPVLEYPPNSRRQFVEKTGTFTWNYTGGQGFRYTQGDQEQIQQKSR